MRERQVRHLVTGGTFNLKYSPAGWWMWNTWSRVCRSRYGRDQPSLRQTNTRDAMAALAEAGILSPEDYTRLRKAHTFLRWLIDSLRVVRGNARDVTVPPEGSEEFAFLARRMQYGSDTAAPARRIAPLYRRCTRDHFPAVSLMASFPGFIWVEYALT